MRPTASVTDRYCLVALAAAVGVFFAPALAGRGVLFFGDTTNYALRLAYTGQWLKAGRFPLWNPLLSLGAPQAVDIGAQTFYPLHPLLSVLLGTRVYDYAAALHVLLAEIGMFALARAFERTRPAALLAAIAYALSGFTFGHLQHLDVLVAIAWIPMLLVTTERYLASSERRSLGLAMLALGLLVLGGHPQLVLYGLFAQALYCVFRLTTLAREGAGSRLPGLVVGILALSLVGIALAAVFLIPFVEWMRFVSRTERVTAEYATWYSLPPARIAGLIAPLWFGGSLGRVQDASRLIEWSSYVGLLPLGLAVVALARPSGRVLFFFALALLALVLALGGNTPIYRLLLAVPVFRSVRAPARFLVLVNLSLAILAAFGLDALRAGAGRRLARFAAMLLSFLAAAVTGAAWIGARSVILLPRRTDPVRIDQADTVVLLLALLGGSALLWGLASRNGPRDSLLVLALLFTGVDVLAFRTQLFFYRLAPPSAWEEPSRNAEAIRRQGDTPRFYTQTGKELEALVFDRRDFEAYRSEMWESLRTSLPMRFGLQSASGHLTEPPAHGMLLALLRERSAFDSRAARLAGAFGIRYVVASPIRGVSAPQLTLVARGVRALYRNEAALPRAYLAPESQVAPDARRAFDLLQGQAFDPRRTVLIEVTGPPMPGGKLAMAQAAIVHEEPDRVTIDTAASRAAWLVLNDTFAPGWKASVDGQPATIFRANALVRAVPVSAGRHRVEFAYSPASVRWGAAISAAALAIVGMLVFPVGARSRPA